MSALWQVRDSGRARPSAKHREQTYFQRHWRIAARVRAGLTFKQSKQPENIQGDKGMKRLGVLTGGGDV
ncbi:MAG: hypothetical protein M1546_17455, partial [Chloroflexi bacterium]|nr:hypothetical protein [Chloroflexota bacterium]